MKVMVTVNVEMDLDLTNGVRGEIVGIVLHPDKPPPGDKSVVTLKHLPAYVLIKLGWTRATQMDGLDENVIPVEMATRTFQIRVRGNGARYVTRTCLLSTISDNSSLQFYRLSFAGANHTLCYH